MLGLLLLYFIGKSFHNLASKYNKNLKWLYVILGIASYYGGLIAGAFIIAILLEMNNSLDSVSDLALGLMSIPIGLLTCGLLHFFLKKKFEKDGFENESQDVLDYELKE